MAKKMDQAEVERQFKRLASQHGCDITWIGAHKRGFLQGFRSAMERIGNDDQALKAYEKRKRSTVKKCLREEAFEAAGYRFDNAKNLPNGQWITPKQRAKS
jgi:hypothetical protein